MTSEFQTSNCHLPFCFWSTSLESTILVVLIAYTSLQVEASVVHVLKALARHQGAAYSLLGDDSLQLLFHMIVMGSTQQMKSEGGSANSVHLAQLRRHVMQVSYVLWLSGQKV